MLSICEWQCALAAYAYEVQDKPLMSDACFDGLASIIKTGGIPGFSAYTGQWVQDMDLELLESLVVYVVSITEPACQGELIRSDVIEALNFFGLEYYCCKQIMDNCEVKTT